MAGSIVWRLFVDPAVPVFETMAGRAASTLPACGCCGRTAMATSTRPRPANAPAMTSPTASRAGGRRSAWRVFRAAQRALAEAGMPGPGRFD
ncbi:hypothetical protein H1235_14235 [Pseudoxanthomonas sp. NC8]|nr:hypothetical protein H1235_14235 [Pseudoxanthomonas sp. NC8]